MLKVIYAKNELLMFPNEEQNLNDGKVAMALYQENGRAVAVKVALDSEKRIHAVKTTKVNNVIENIVLANVDSKTRTLSQKKSKEIMDYFNANKDTREATFSEVFSSGSDENGKSIKDNVITFDVKYNGLGAYNHFNYRVVNVSSSKEESIEFLSE